VALQSQNAIIPIHIVETDTTTKPEVTIKANSTISKHNSKVRSSLDGESIKS
jgi:hypothetical protein